MGFVSGVITGVAVATTRRIAVIPGDGIGLEVVPVALDVLAAATRGVVTLETVEFPWSCDFYLETGAMMPPDGLDTLRAFDAIFLGAVGDPSRVPDTVSLWGLLLRIRKGLGLAVNVRPARFMAGMPTPLKDPAAFDVVVVRENTEGEYSDVGGRIHEGDREIAIQVNVFTRLVRDGAVTTRRIMSATLSSDHRVVDGVGAARFLGTLKALLEAPAAWARLDA